VAAVFLCFARGVPDEPVNMSTNPRNIIISESDPADETSLLDILDHVLNAGVIIRGNIVISLAGVDLIYVGRDVLLSSFETALRHLNGQTPATLHT
jgi:gas vesicle structural protein